MLIDGCVMMCADQCQQSAEKLQHVVHAIMRETRVRDQASISAIVAKGEVFDQMSWLCPIVSVLTVGFDEQNALTFHVDALDLPFIFTEISHHHITA